MKIARHKQLIGWMQLLRPPNLLTVPGDPVAGFLLASASTGVHTNYLGMLPGAVIALLFYMAGLVSNDCFDRQEDAMARPERPIPSGTVSFHAATLFTLLLFAAGLSLAGLTGGRTLATALVLMLFIVAYNGFGKKIPLVGSLLMGACRGLSLLLGAASTEISFTAWNAVTLAAAGALLYIAAVTSLAAHETEKKPMPVRRWLPAAAVAACVAGLLTLGGTVTPIFMLLALAATAYPFFIAWRLSACPDPGVLIPSIGAFIRGLLLIQAAWMAFSGGPGMIAAFGVLCVWPVSVYLSRWFYAS